MVEGGVYHVYNRVASGEAVLGEVEEARRFVELIREVKRRDGWTVFAWCVLSNHYHLALRTSVVPLWRGLHHLQCSFSRGFNRRHGRTGSLWQSRYQAKLVDESRYLAQLVTYIHLNPVRAGLARDPVDYPLGGHREIMKRVRSPLVDVDDCLLCFGDTARVARAQYRSRIEAGVAESAGDVDRPPADRWLVRGSDREPQPKPGQILGDMLGVTSELERPRLEAARFVAETCRLLGVEPARLASRLRDRPTAELRRLVAALGLERWSQRTSALAEVLGRNPEVVSYWVGEGVRRRLADPDFAGRLDDLDRALAEAVGRTARHDDLVAPADAAEPE